jgi:hypothetical protein
MYGMSCDLKIAPFSCPKRFGSSKTEPFAHREEHALTFPKRLEPSEPDKSKCPICFADARPRSLRIDKFLFGVRRQLEEQDKLDTKPILVAANGTWRPVIEPIDHISV